MADTVTVRRIDLLIVLGAVSVVVQDDTHLGLRTAWDRLFAIAGQGGEGGTDGP